MEKYVFILRFVTRNQRRQRGKNKKTEEELSNVEKYVDRILDYAVQSEIVSKDTQKVVRYGLLYLINVFGSFLGFMILGYLFGYPELVFIGVVVGSGFRFVSGGAHFSHPLLCFLYSGSISYEHQRTQYQHWQIRYPPANYMQTRIR